MDQVADVLALKAGAQAAGDSNLLKAIAAVEALSAKVEDLQHELAAKDEFAEALVHGVRTVDNKMDAMKKQLSNQSGNNKSVNLDGLCEQIHEMETQLNEKDQFAKELVEGMRTERERLAVLQAQYKQLEQTHREKEEFAAEMVAETRRNHSLSVGRKPETVA